MTQGFSINVGGNRIQINAGASIDDIKSKLSDNMIDLIFQGVDTNKNGQLDADELEILKKNLKNNNYTVEVSQDGKTPKQAFNDAIQNMGNRYDKNSLKTNFKSDDAELHEIKYGDTLYHIAKKALQEEGLPTDNRSVNNRIAEIAKINNLKDVNNVPIGTKIIYKLTQAGIDKVNSAEGQNSAVAFTQQVTPQPETSNKPQNVEGSQQNPQGAGASQGTPITFNANSTITITENIDYRNMPDWTKEEIVVDEDKNYKATKHTKEGEADVYQMATEGINIHGASVDEVKAKFDKYIKEYTAKPESETEDAAKTRKDGNLQILKGKLEAADYSIDAIKALAEDFRNDDLIDRDSDDYKSLVRNLLLTHNAEVIEALLPGEYDVDMTVVEKDKTAHEYLAGMYQEIRNNEKAGLKLSPEDIKLKDRLEIIKRNDGYKIEADTDEGIHEKYMAYDNMDGKPMYQIFIGGNWYFAESPELLDEFLTKLDAADTDEKKAALFKEYINTDDKELAKCLAQNAKALKASDEDIISLINANGLEVLSALDDDSEVDASDYSAEVIKSVVVRAKEIYTTDKGNLENAVYLNDVTAFINALPEDGENPVDKYALSKEILETYFDKTETTDTEGNTTTTYTFNPSRRPTYKEMFGLATLAFAFSSSVFEAALVDYIKLEDMGEGQYNDAIEYRFYHSYTVPHYAEMVEGMSTASDITDFIDNKVATDRNCHLPYDAIIAKLEGFSEDEKKQILDRLVKYANKDSKISDENKLLLAKHCMQIDDKGNVTFDKTKLPEGVDAMKILNYFLPKDCTDGDAKKCYDAIINTLDKSELDIITEYSSKNPETAKARIKALLEANPADKEFVRKVLDIETELIPYDTIRNLDAAGWDDETKKLVFLKAYDGKIVRSDWQETLNNAVNKHLISHVEGDYYAIGDKMYDVNYKHSDGTDKGSTADDVMGFKSFSKTGYENGIKMYDQLKGAGSGDIAKMLRSSKDEGYENFVTPDNVVGIIKGFNQKSPDEGLMEYIANENRMSSGVKPGKALCNRIPKALMRKAAKLYLTDTEAYKELAKFFGAEGNPKDETFKFTQNDEAAIRYDAATAKELDRLIQSLVNTILPYS